MASRQELTIELAKEEARRKAIDAFAKGYEGVHAYVVTEDPLLWDIVGEHVHMTSAKFSGFLTPPPPLSAFGSDLQYRIHATSLTTSAFEVPPPPSQRRRHMYMPPNGNGS